MAYDIISQITSPTSDALDFTGLSLGSWRDIQIKLEGITVGTDGAALQAQFYIGGSLISSGYRYVVSAHSNAGSSTSDDSVSAASILVTRASANGIGNATDESYSAIMSLYNSTEALNKHITGQGVYTDTAAGLRRIRFMGYLADTGTLDGIKFTPSTGTLTAGKATIFGIQ